MEDIWVECNKESPLEEKEKKNEAMKSLGTMSFSSGKIFHPRLETEARGTYFVVFLFVCLFWFFWPGITVIKLKMRILTQKMSFVYVF